MDGLDFGQALKNVRIDILGDWHRDPWGWPELEWLSKQGSSVLRTRLRSNGVWRATKIDVAKENYSTRPAIVMDPADRLAYQALVDRISVPLSAPLQPWVFGWRLPRTSPCPPGVYANNSREWKDFVARLSSMSHFNYGLATDVVSCFASMPIEPTIASIESRAGRNKITQRLGSLLRGWARIPGRSGIPQRSLASAVLVNTCLSALDVVLDKYSPRNPRFGFQRCCRWMDDIWLFGHTPGELRGAQLELQDRLRELGLHMNLGKTEVVERAALASRIEDFQHSGIEQDLSRDPPDIASLDRLIDQVLAQAERSPRTSVKFATVRMRKQKAFNRVQEFITLAERLPHVADSLARLFRDAGVSRDMGNWYIEYKNGPWGKIDWSVCQFGTMFPGKEAAPQAVRDYFVEELIDGSTTVLVPLAAERTAAWMGQKARAVFREAIGRSNHPFERRAIALAAVSLGEERAVVERWLDEFPETNVTAKFLRQRNFRPIRTVPDFDGATD